MSALLEVEDLRVDLLTDAGDVGIVDGVSFRIDEREILGLAGESGSGKSTIGHALLRLLRPPAVITGGAVRFAGRDVLDLDDAALRGFRWRQVSMVMQSAMNALSPVITVGEQIADAILAHERRPRNKVDERIAELLALVGIDPARRRAYPHELSGGQRQRVTIAMALALSPRLVIMDEPTTALDVVMQREILAQIAELRERLGFAVLFITHDLSLMLELCDRVGVLYAGRLVEVAPAARLRDDARHPYTQALLRAFPDVRRPKATLDGIPGAPPDPRRPPPGCRFHPRCPSATAACREAAPAAVRIEREREVSCHLVPGGLP